MRAGADHQAEVEHAADDVKASVLETEEVQVLAPQLHAAGWGGISGHAVVLPTTPQLCLLIVISLDQTCRSKLLTDGTPVSLWFAWAMQRLCVQGLCVHR